MIFLNPQSITMRHLETYLAPELEVIQIQIELGFANSTNLEDPDENPEIDW